MRTWKKIEETKKRATEVMTLKQKNEIKIQQKMDQLRMNQMVQEENQKKINHMRAQRDMERQKIQEAIYLSKKEEVKQQKYIQVANKQRKHVFYSQAAQDAAAKNQMIKQQERIAQLKKEEFIRRKQMEAKIDQEKKMAEEEAVIRQKEQEVMQMEMLEMELIKKLQNTQAIQKQAYAELENALSKQGPGTSYTAGGQFGKLTGGLRGASGGGI